MAEKLLLNNVRVGFMGIKIVPAVAVFVIAISFIVDISFTQEFDQPYGIESLNDIDNIAPIRQQVLKEEEWLRWRKKHIVPEVMKRVHEFE